MRNSLSYRLLFVALCGAFAGWCLGLLVPDEIAGDQIELRAEKYTASWEDDPFAITDALRLPVPFSFADFDMELAVELGEGAIVDLIVRIVEPRQIGESKRLKPFHGRFSVLRLSADREWPAWLSREEALLGDREAGGVDLLPGSTATVWLQGRGRWLQANVAGKVLPPFEADDVYGSFLFAARGGTAVIKSMKIEPRGQPYAFLWSRWFWVAMGALLGLLVMGVGIAVKASALVVGPLLALTALALWFLNRDGTAVLQHPPPVALFALLGASGCIALCAAPRNFVLAAVGLGLLFIAPLSHDESALDAAFGPNAGSSLSEAQVQLVRGPRMIHDAGPSKARVFLLGGQLLYGNGLPDEHLEGLLAADLAAALGIVRPRRVDVPCLPTTDGHTRQQWDMFSRFYQRYRPGVIVLGVPDLEGVEDPATGKPRSYPSTVERVIAEALTWCRENDARLVLLADDELPEPFLNVLKAAADRGVPLVIAAAGEARKALSKRLTAVIAPLLR